MSLAGKPPIKPSRSHDIGQMLHRSPSGAKRRIRQKREEQASRPSPFLSPSSSSSQASNSPTPTDSSSSHYRNLIESGDYQSILPDIEPTSFQPPVPTPRLSVPFSNSMSSLELSSSSTMFQSSLLPPMPPPMMAKPTVEVHPMPTDERSSMSSSLNGSIDMELYKPKPPVPAKPKGLLVDHLNRSTSMTSLSSPVQHTTTAFLTNFLPTPSLINLQQGYRNPDLGSQDLAKLENTRHESIQKVARKLGSYEEERYVIENELEEIERTGARLLQIVERHDKNLAAKIRRHMENSKELIGIETNLRLQMTKLEDRTIDGVIDKSSAQFEESRLRRRFNETDLLRKIYSRREKDHDKEVAEIFTEEELRRWLLFKDATIRLLKDETAMEYCINESKMKLDALHLAPSSRTSSA